MGRPVRVPASPRKRRLDGFPGPGKRSFLRNQFRFHRRRRFRLQGRNGRDAVFPPAQHPVRSMPDGHPCRPPRSRRYGGARNRPAFPPCCSPAFPDAGGSGKPAADQHQNIVHRTQALFQKEGEFFHLRQYFLHRGVHGRFPTPKEQMSFPCPATHSRSSRPTWSRLPEEPRREGMISTARAMRALTTEKASSTPCRNQSGFPWRRCQRSTMSEYRPAGPALHPQGRNGVPLKAERTDNDADDIGRPVPGKPRDFRSHAGPRTAAKPGGDDGQVAAFQGPQDGGFTFPRRLGAPRRRPRPIPAPG